jgi:hypothetical protein
VKNTSALPTKPTVGVIVPTEPEERSRVPALTSRPTNTSLEEVYDRSSLRSQYDVRTEDYVTKFVAGSMSVYKASTDWMKTNELEMAWTEPFVR